MASCRPCCTSSCIEPDTTILGVLALSNRACAITPREVLAKFKTMQMVDVQLPTTDGRELTLSRYTPPETEHRMLLEQLRLDLPRQPPPKITAALVATNPVEPVL